MVGKVKTTVKLEFSPEDVKRIIEEYVATNYKELMKVTEGNTTRYATGEVSINCGIQYGDYRDSSETPILKNITFTCER